ncbi:hypothetical protein HYALB_00007996 [Hymenoscyphus albidus]|uniref:Peptidase C14 caspase domain-containing protein n=1 Tax=Hymenoscyphus albidus TaxID=595503 RepID=A0A9N9LCI7_9HELO|nr:hypothetical protein HYALB_00007996 [Hymenoscyphus albidus]
MSNQLQLEVKTSGTLHQPESHQDKVASDDFKMKAIWDAEIKNPSRKPLLYREAAALLISWDDGVDDLKTGEEVDRLQRLLEDTFNYKTVKGVLYEKTHPSPQIQINRHLANFVGEYDKPDTLLIVYYAGHGKPGEPENGLTFVGRQDLNPKPDASSHEIIWGSTEHNIRHATSDILVIFDCCHAAQLEKNVRSAKHRRAYEYLAATSAGSTTNRPGPTSFTTAMIWAMKSLVETGEGFTIQRLLHTIINEAPDFPDDQFPRQSEGVSSCLRKLTLTPLKVDTKHESISNEARDEEGPTTDLSLRFVFNSPSVSPTLISHLAKEISNCLSNDQLKGSMVVWEGLNTRPAQFDESPVLLNYYAHRWLKKSLKRKGRAQVSNITETKNGKRDNCESSMPERKHLSATDTAKGILTPYTSETSPRTPVSGAEDHSDDPIESCSPKRRKFSF